MNRVLGCSAGTASRDGGFTPMPVVASQSRGKACRRRGGLSSAQAIHVLDNVIIAFVLLQVLLLEFFFTGRQLNHVGVVLIVVRALGSDWRRMPGTSVLLGVMVMLLAMASAFSGPVLLETIKSNCLMMLYPALYVWYFYLLYETRPVFLTMLLDKGYVFFNAVFAINFIVVLIQANYPYSLLAYAPPGYELSAAYFDHITGFFGLQSTPALGVFMLFVVTYDIAFCIGAKRGRQRMLRIVVAVIVLALSVYISDVNSTKANFLFIPVVLVLLYLSSRMVSSHLWCRAGSFVAAFVALLVAVVAVYWVVPAFRGFVDDKILRLLQIIQDSVLMGNDARGTNERFAVIGYALGQPNTWLFGYGFGLSSLATPDTLGFRHFGQSDFCSFVLLGGIWFYLAINALYTYMFVRMSVPSNCRHKKLLAAGIYVFCISMSVYTQCFSKVNIAVCLMLLFLACGMIWRLATNEAAPRAGNVIL